MVHLKPRNHLVGLGKLLEGKTNGSVMNQNIDLRRQSLICKNANANLGIKISRDTISRRCDEKRFLKRTNWVDWNLPQNTSYGLKNSGIVFRSAMSQSLFSAVVMGEGSFDAIRRNNIHNSSLKAALYFGGRNVMVLGMISVAGHHHHHHHVTLPARISLTLSRHPSLSSIAPGRFSRLYPLSKQSCCI